ncbi:MAG: DNA cytosine methyltransferase [Lacrimispora sphenoides]
MGFEVFDNYECDGQMELTDCTVNRQLTHLSLFSGIGGLDLAAEWAGFESVGQCEWADYPTKVLEKHWPDVSRWRDIRTLTGESFYERTNRRTVDIISGGFPCQPFSVAGKQRGKDDDRYLWPEMVRVIKELRPTWVVGENVAGIINMALDTVLSDLEAAGYTVRTFVIPACGVDAPHQRYRTAIVAHSKGIFTGGLPVREEQKKPRPCKRSENVAGSNGNRFGGEGTGKPDNDKEWNGETQKQGRGAEPYAPVSGREAISNTDSPRCEEFDISTVTDQQGFGGGEGDEGYVPNPNGERLQAERSEQQTAGVTGDSQTDGAVCNTAGQGLQNGSEKPLGMYREKQEPKRSDWWAAEPGVGRVANGIPSRVDRIKCLGNAVVPAQFYPIFQAIADIELHS